MLFHFEDDIPMNCISLWCIGLTGKATCLNRKCTKHCLKKPIIITLFSKIFIKKPRHQSDSMRELPPKKAKYWKKKPKSQTIFFDMTPTTFKKAKFVKFDVRKANLATLEYLSWLSGKILRFSFGPGVKNLGKTRPSVKWNFWPLQSFSPVIVSQLFCFSE